MKNATQMTPAQKNEAARLYDMGFSPAESLYRAGAAPAPARQVGSLYSTEGLTWEPHPRG